MISRCYIPEPKQSFFLFGPRGTGKSRFLKKFFKGATLIDLLDDATLLKFINDPARLEPIVKNLKINDVIIIDEVQKSPQILNKVHQIMEDENFPKVQFVLTGSSIRKLKKSGADLLAGRALLNFMHPFMV
jgi:predicted AAA+ superfamily ATPase